MKTQEPAQDGFFIDITGVRPGADTTLDRTRDSPLTRLYGPDDKCRPIRP